VGNSPRSSDFLVGSFALRRLPADRAAEFAVLAFILAVAAVGRLWFLTAGVPYAVGIDEPQIVDRALRILHTGDWNTHLFDYPTLVIYLHAVLAIVRFLWGATAGEWSSLDALSIGAIYTTGRVATAVIGVATVWIVYRLGMELGDRRVGLIGAAQLAVYPMHVRESHFVLTDVPATALTALTVWLALVAARTRRPQAYAWAGAAAGLAAAAKYNAGIAFIAVVVVWVLTEWRAPDRIVKAAAAIGGLAIAFLVAAPYTLLDLPSFLNGFAAQFARFAGAPRSGEPAWLLYIKHLSLSGRYWLPVVLAGVVIVCIRPIDRRRWAPLLAFVAVYFYALSTHAPVFGRYALPLLPALCLLAAVPIVTLVDRIPQLNRPSAGRAALIAATLAMTFPFIAGDIGWLRDSRRLDTRTIAATWMAEHLPAGAALAVENSGPTYLSNAGFRVLTVQLVMDHPVEWYRGRVDYLVISSRDRTEDYDAAGQTVFEVASTPQRWGPGIRIVKLGGSPQQRHA
jgi:4-amino-4-deoxy-L-arabinose transferase-like glycosyltransferase